MLILLPFFDDSTLFYAIAMYKILQKTEHTGFLGQVVDKKGEMLSERQLILLKEVPFSKITLSQLHDATYLVQFDVIIMPKFIQGGLSLQNIKNYKSFVNKRPVLYAGWVGLNLTKKLGIEKRINFDGILFIDPYVLELGRKKLHDAQKAFKFFPPLYTNNLKKVNVHNSIKTIYFLAQAVIPSLKEERLQFLKILVKIANNNPDKNVFIKLRHLPCENTQHPHKEEFSYISLLDEVNKTMIVPCNLSFSSKSMEEIIKDADYCITALSTGGLETLMHGIPTAFFIGNVNNETELYSAYWLQNYLGDMNIFYTEHEIQQLAIKPINEKTLKDFISTKEDLEKIIVYAQQLQKEYDSSSDWLFQKIKNAKSIKRYFEKLLVRIFTLRHSKKFKKYLHNRKQFFLDSSTILLKKYGKNLLE